MTGIFINYRKDDSQTAAALIDRELTARFGSDQVFLDSRSIPAGRDFVKELLGRLRTCSVLLVVIGPHWLTLTNEVGQRRIDDPKDWIRREIKEALRQGLRVIPVLLDDGKLPAKDDLPKDIAELSRRQYVHLRNRFTSLDLGFLVERIIEQPRQATGLWECLGLSGPPPRIDHTSALDLRVQPAIELPLGIAPARPAAAHGPGEALSPDLPTFVEREIGPRVCRWMTEARENGGFLVLVGDPSVGKTRLAYETARRVVPDFAVLAPDLGDGRVVNGLAETRLPLPKMVVWLDELQRFLDGPYLCDGSTPVTAGTIRRLLDAPTPVIIIGTLWPVHVTELREIGSASGGTTGAPRHPRAYDVLSMSRLSEMYVRTFSREEQRAAVRLSSHDPRLADALDPDFNVTEVLAGARELIRRYECAAEEQQAILHAAVDARRLGVHAPLTEELLGAAARGYLITVHHDDNWLVPTLTELAMNSRPHDRGVSPLIAKPNEDRSDVLSFTVADHLLQHLVWRRRREPIPAIVWQAIIMQTRNYDDLGRVARSADARMRYTQAEDAYRRLVDEGRFRDAASRLAEIMALQGRENDLRRRTADGDVEAARRLVGLLLEAGKVDQAIDVLGRLEEKGTRDIAHRLADLLATAGRIDEAFAVLRRHADQGDSTCAERLADLLATHGRELEVRTRAERGDRHAAAKLARMLASQGRDEELRDRANGGDVHAVRELVGRLVAQGKLGGATGRLREHVGRHGWDGLDATVTRLVELLVEQHRVDDAVDILAARADGRCGRPQDAVELAELLARLGRWDEAVTVLSPHAGDDGGPASSVHASLLARQGKRDELRRLAAVGGLDASRSLVDLLVGQGDELALRTLAEQENDVHAAGALADMLNGRGDTDRAIEVLRPFADTKRACARRLSTLLVDRHRPDDVAELRRKAATDRYAALGLMRLPAGMVPRDEIIDALCRLAHIGDTQAASCLVDLLARESLFEELREEVDAGTSGAADQAVALVEGRLGRRDGERMRRFGLDQNGEIAGWPLESWTARLRQQEP